MDCEDCKNYVEYAGYQKLTPTCKECVDEGYQSNWENIKSKFEPKHKQTNADRILEDGFYAIRDGKLYKVDFPDKGFGENTIKIEIPNYSVRRETNAERIRQMSDEELATFLGFVLQDGYCYGAGMRKELKFIPVSEHNEMVEWLKKEVDE